MKLNSKEKTEDTKNERKDIINQVLHESEGFKSITEQIK